VVFALEANLMSAISLVISIATLWALADAATRKNEVYLAADKLTKQAWLLILGLSLAVVLLFQALSILGFFAIVAMLVYFLDVRPALVALTRRR
jgi:hypothetical protein